MKKIQCFEDFWSIVNIPLRVEEKSKQYRINIEEKLMMKLEEDKVALNILKYAYQEDYYQ
jgi:hypothetical protein